MLGKIGGRILGGKYTDDPCSGQSQQELGGCVNLCSNGSLSPALVEAAMAAAVPRIQLSTHTSKAQSKILSRLIDLYASYFNVQSRGAVEALLRQPARPGSLTMKVEVIERPGARLSGGEDLGLARLAILSLALVPTLLGVGGGGSRGLGRFVLTSYTLDETLGGELEERLGQVAKGGPHILDAAKSLVTSALQVYPEIYSRASASRRLTLRDNPLDLQKPPESLLTNPSLGLALGLGTTIEANRLDLKPPEWLPEPASKLYPVYKTLYKIGLATSFRVLCGKCKDANVAIAFRKRLFGLPKSQIGIKGRLPSPIYLAPFLAQI